MMYHKSAAAALEVLMATNRILQFLQSQNISKTKCKKAEILTSLTNASLNTQS